MRSALPTRRHLSIMAAGTAAMASLVTAAQEGILDFDGGVLVAEPLGVVVIEVLSRAPMPPM
ncbi:MAG: hypothetical protein R3D67_06930 [Hyphomicrobiaceae bacterium]